MDANVIAIISKFHVHDCSELLQSAPILRMDPNESDWLGSCKSQPVRDAPSSGNIAQSWQWRERGINPMRGATNRTILEQVAEDRLVHKGPLNIKCCDLPGYPRSTFLMVFSPDGTTVASTHGNHNIYLTELASGKHVRILKGHPRTPWCIAFHPSHAELVGSGCLGGQVRVWDLSGGSEVWTVDKETVIASIAFHPRDQLLVVATFNELYFWDWSQPQPFTKVCTNNINEKVRYVAFDALGHKLITGIAVWAPGGGGASSLLQAAAAAAQDAVPGDGSATPESPESSGGGGGGGAGGTGAGGAGARQPDGSAQELIFTSYHNLVQHYDSLVRNYHRIFLARSQGTNTTDRGTDPMEVDGAAAADARARLSAVRSTLFNVNPRTRAAEQQRAERNESEANPSSRLLSLDILSLDNTRQHPWTAPTAPPERDEQSSSSNPTAATQQQDGHSIFGSRSSAFQPLLENRADRSVPYSSTEYQRRIFRRVLPNPFSSGSLSQTDLRHRISNRNSSASRTRAFSRTPNSNDNRASAARADVEHRRNSSSRTRGFTNVRQAEVPNDADVSTNRSLLVQSILQRTFPGREFELYDEPGSWRRTLERLLELERIPAEEPEPSRTVPPPPQEAPSPPEAPPPQGPPPRTRTALEQMLFGPTQNAAPGIDSIPLPIPPPPTISHYNLFEPPEPSQAPAQRDPNLRALLNFNTPAPNDPSMPTRPFPSLNFFMPAPSLDNEPDGNDRPVEVRDNLQYFGQNASVHVEPTPAPVVAAAQTTNSATSTTTSQPTSTNVLSENITQSLDIIRDILRDSGNRLLNLITDMSLSTLAGVGEASETEHREQTPDEDMYTALTSRADSRRRRILVPSASPSDSDSDRSLEVNIYRSRNATIPESRRTDTNIPEGERPRTRPISRMVVNLELVDPTEEAAAEGNSIRRTLNNNLINITVPNNRFHLRTSNVEDNPQTSEQRSDNSTVPDSANAVPTASTSTSEHPAGNSDSPTPSTSRDTDWLYNSIGMPPGQRPAETPLSAADALRKVKLGIAALQQHTTLLTDMWLSGTRTLMRDIRLMWEDLRRQVVALQRQSSRNEAPGYFARSILDRCNMLNDLSRRLTGNAEAGDQTRSTPTGNTTETAIQANVPTDSELPDSRHIDNVPGASAENRGTREVHPSTSRDETDNATPSAAASRTSSWARNKRPQPTAARPNFKARSNPSTRRRMQAATPNRWRPGEEHRRRQRIAQRIEQYMQSTRNANRVRPRENSRHIELHFTRHEIRLRAMQVLSIMFNMMMACLEERELSSQIIVMLRTLKKALGVTCLLLMTNRTGRRDSASNQNRRRRNSAGANSEIPRQGASGPTSQPTHENASTSLESQPITANVPVHAHEPPAPLANADAISSQPNNNVNLQQNTGDNAPFHFNLQNILSPAPNRSERHEDNPSRLGGARSGARNFEMLYNPPEMKANKSTSTPEQPGDSSEQGTSGTCNEPLPSTSYKWSNRLAVQISAANNNRSETAKGRKDIYLDRKRQKALHRYNPIAHPLTKRRIISPLVSQRIPMPRVTPARRAHLSVSPENIASGTRPHSSGVNGSQTSTAGPSNPQPSTSAEEPPAGTSMSRQEYRAGLFRFAQLHASRLRNATLNRYRIRLYTPSSVREMFDILATNGNEREPESPPTLNNAPENRRPFSTYWPRFPIVSRNNLESLNQGPEGSRPFGSILNNVSVPLVQVNNVPVNDPQGGGDAPLRVNEYLQPIILAQNALGVEESVGGGLLEAGLISESLVVPVHRVQAWDFTRGAAPDIKDSSKNVVVQRCKIHNDASIDISRDGRLLVALLPVHRMRNMSNRLGVYSLEWGRLGQCLHTAVLEQSAVSVALSPTARHLAVGLGSRRVTTLPHNRNNVFALLFRLANEGPANENARQCGLIPVRILDHNWEHGFTSLNCLRWAPAPGQGLLYANNTGQLIIMS